MREMTNDEDRMTNDEVKPKPKCQIEFVTSSFIIRHSFVIRHSSFVISVGLSFPRRFRG